ncbi:potassium channel family protein [Methylobacterium segetis]|uniref:potassium channel family protein n=1 Tax=Methylobacterium segetis TaxID=2488750 RepID=UPI001045D74D|nr:potassium channel family protein [Methylobacterium segetis]
MSTAASSFGRLRSALRSLYEGTSSRAHRFRYGLLAFDIVTVAFIVVTSFLPRMPVLEGIDLLFGLGVAADLAARILIAPRPWREFGRLSTWTDLIAILSFLAPVVGEGAGFLRILRTLRLFQNYHLQERLRRDSSFFRANEEVIEAGINLGVFIFVMTSLVYATQHWSNPSIANSVDALYFTVTSLTTTGYGDVTLPGTVGRLLSVVIMLCGVTLFLRLAQVLVRPHRVRFPCPACGLQRHEADAVHCKACGHILNIPDEGGD